ncbi:MAG: hypothetical protein IKZ07_07300 [Akkermansia sp.]|nr:hypothetical protein [Akkermansia sp.]
MYSNTAFIPQHSAPLNQHSAPLTQSDSITDSGIKSYNLGQYIQRDSGSLLAEGIYNYANSKRDAACAAAANRIFGSNLIDPDDTTLSEFAIGSAIIEQSGFSGNPAAYYKAKGWTMPTGYGSRNNLLRDLGARTLYEMRTLYDAEQKRLEEARQNLANLPTLITDSIYSANALGADALFKAKALTPDDLERISKFYDKENAQESYQRALTAWTSFSGFMHSVDSLQSMKREDLRDIAAILNDKDGKPDALATAVLSLLVDRRATAMQSENPEAWAIFSDSLQNWAARSNDQELKNRATQWNEMVDNWAAAGISQEEINRFRDNRFNSQEVETLYGLLQHALNTSMSASEKAEWHAKAIASAAKMVGESVVPSLVSMGVTALTRGRGFGAVSSAASAYTANVAVNADALINAAVADAYLQGKVNPEIHGRIEGGTQALSEGAIDAGTSLPLVGKLVGKGTNKLAAATATSRVFGNLYARTTLNYLTAGAVQGIGELAEEEIGAALGSAFNALARKAGVQLSPQQYKLGQALSSMQSYEVAALFGYSYALGMLGIPADFKSARTFALNTDNLLNAGHSPEAVRDIQSHILNAQDKATEIYSDPKLTKEQKQDQVDKLWESVNQYQKDKAQTDIYDADPEIVRQRLEAQKKKTLTKAELALAIQGEIDLRIAKDAGIIDATAQPGDKFAVTLIEKGGTNEDDSKAPDKLVQQEWTRNQLVNYFQIQHNKILTHSLRGFQGLVQAHAAAQTITDIDGLKVQLQELREIPYEAYASLKKHQGITTEYIAELISLVRANIAQHESAGMTRAEAEAQPSNFLPGLSLGELLALQGAAEERRDSAADTTEGKAKGITKGQSVEYGAFNITRADGSILIAYVAGRADVNDILEDLIEAHIKHTVATTGLTYTQLGNTIKEIEKHLPPVTMPDGKVQKLTLLPAGKTEYTQQNIIEAYSKLALANYLYNEQYLPLTQGGHRPLREIGRVVDTARLYKAIGDAWFTYANSEQGKTNLANGGQTFADLLTNAGFKIGSLVAQARATAEQTQKVIEGRNFQPDPAQEVKALINRAEAEQQLADINARQAAEPTTIPAAESITGKEITIDPVSEQETLVSIEPDPAANLRNLIAQGKATEKDFAEFFTKHPITHAAAIEQGLVPITQDGQPSAAYIKGRQEAQASSTPSMSIKAVQTPLFSDIKAAKAELKKIQGQTFINGKVHAVVSGQTIGKTHAAQMSVRNLTALGYSEEEARKIHYSACTKIHEIFESSPYGFFEPNYDQSSKKGRAGAWHYFGVVEVEGYGEFDVNVTAIKTEKESDANPLFSLELTIENPSGVSGDTLSQRGRALRSEGSSGSRLAAYRSFVEKEMSIIKKKAQEDGTFMLAPNGKPTNLDEKQWLTVRTAAFKNWFGDWENAPANASKVVDENGEPLVVYHGTRNGGFTIFDDYANEKNSDAPDGSFFFTDKQALAKDYASEYGYWISGSQIYSVFLNMKNPLIVDFEGNRWNFGGKRVYLQQGGKRILAPGGSYFKSTTEARKYARENNLERAYAIEETGDTIAGKAMLDGYDGVIMKNVVDPAEYSKGQSLTPGTNYVCFNNTQIKSATNNRGTFDGSNPDINFSIKAARPTADRFKASPLGHNMLYFIRNEARRYARIFGDKSPHEQAVNAAQSAAAIIAGVDKYLQRTGTESKPVPQSIRRRLQHLQKVAEKYAQIIATGRTRSFKKLAPQEQAELQAAIADLQQQEQEAAITEADKLLTDSDRLTKKERTARQKEHDRTILREAAKGRVYATLAAMLEAAADALDTHLKNEILVDINRITAPVKIKRTASGRLKGKMTATIYRKLEQAIQFMALSPRALETAIDDVFTAQETLATAINNGDKNLTGGNALLTQLADQLTQDGIKVTPQTLTAAFTDYSNALAIYGDIESKNYEQTRLAANALFHLIQYGRNKWADRQAQREAEIQQYLQHFLANTTAESGRANAKNKATAEEAKKILNGSVLDKFMNSTQLFTALASYEPLRPLFEHLRYQLSLSLDTRQKHLNEIREQELAAFGRLLGIKPETAAGYTSKQLQQLSDQFDAFYVENNTTHNTGITVTWQAENQDGKLKTYSEELECTNWELLDLLLMYRQEHYQANAELHGFTPEILTQIEKHIGQQLMDYGNAIQQIIIGDGTIPVYEEREGIPMRHNPLYWPGSVNINTLNTTREEPLVNPYHPAGSYDFLKSRVRNLKELRPQNAYSKFRSAIAQRANYIYLDPVTAPLRSLLARDQFANRLTALIGPSLTNQLKTTINEIVGAGHNETSLQDIGGNNKFGNALSHATLAALAGNINSIVRQASAAANAGLMPGISPVDYYKYAILVRDNNTNIGITDVLKLDCFAIRRRDNAYVNELAAMGADAKYSTLLNWTKAGMNLMDKADVLANAVSAAIVYNHKYDQLKATGRYTEEQLRARAEAEVSQYLRLAAQPLNRVDKSALYWQLSQSALGRSILYMGSESINKLGMLRLNYIINRNNGTGAAKNTGMLLAKMGLTVGLASAAINALIDLLAGNTPDDDDNLAAWAMYQWLWGTVGQHTDAMPVLGSFTNAWLSPYARFGDSGVTIPGKNINTRTSKLHTMLADNKTYSAEQWNKAITNFMRETSAISGYLGGTYAPWQWFSTVSSVLSSLTTVANTVNVLLPAANTITEWATGEQSKDRRTKRRRRLKSKAEATLESTIETANEYLFD